MIEIVKVCKHHGELNKSQIRIIKYKGKQSKKCIQCEKIRSKKYFDKNREAKRIKDNLYWKENKEKITKRRQQPEKLAKRREWGKENKERYAPFYREKQRKYKEELAPAYVKKVIQNGNKSLKFNHIPSVMVELKIAIMKAKRALKLKNNELKLEKLELMK